jgi:hypothetical protein
MALSALTLITGRCKIYSNLAHEKRRKFRPPELLPRRGRHAVVALAGAAIVHALPQEHWDAPRLAAAVAMAPMPAATVSAASSPGVGPIRRKSEWAPAPPLRYSRTSKPAEGSDRSLLV